MPGTRSTPIFRVSEWLGGLVIAVGVALELRIHALSGRREAWDSPLYWEGNPIGREAQHRDRRQLLLETSRAWALTHALPKDADSERADGTR
ncbi:MAG: hypothetical protein ACRD1Q_10475, partial [Vicinamibacterales bacterium]